MRGRALLTGAVALLGAVLAAMAVLMLAAAVAGNVAQGQTGWVMQAIGLLLFSAPALAWPFSSRVARALLFLALSALALLSLWLVFWPQGVTQVPVLTRIAVIAFVVLLGVRMWISARRTRAATGVEARE